MIVSRYFSWSGLSVVLVACWSSLALGSAAFGQPALDSSPVPAPAPQDSVVVSDLVAPDPIAPAVCHCAPAGNRSGGLFRWFWRKSESYPTAEFAGQCSGCNVHPEPPFGTSYHATMQSQIANGEAALMVLHQFDFVSGEATLNDRGRLRLQRIAGRLPQNVFPIIIEASRHNPGLDQARHAGVIAELARMPFPVPVERIVVGLSPARGLDGLDAEIIHQNRLRQTAAGGAAGQPAAPTAGAGGAVPSPR